MKIIIVILHGLLLDVLSHQQEKCQKEKQRAQFYIYNANVNITINPCIRTDTYVGDICKLYNYRETKINNSDIIAKCMNFAPGIATRIGTNFYSFDGKQTFLTLCELPARAKLVNNTVETRFGLRQYTDEGFYYTNHHYYILWTSNVCRDLNFIYDGYFDVWRINNKIEYIRNEHISLKLTEYENLCGSKIWNSDYDGIIVSTQRIKTSVSTNLPQTYQSTLPRDCNVLASTEGDPTKSFVNESTTNVSKINVLHNKNIVVILNNDVPIQYIGSEKERNYIVETRKRLQILTYMLYFSFSAAGLTLLITFLLGLFLEIRVPPQLKNI